MSDRLEKARLIEPVPTWPDCDDDGPPTDDLITGTIDPDYLTGGAGNDTIRGGLGQDTIIGGTGNDLLKGEEDDDFIRGCDGDDTIYGGDGHDTIKGDDGQDLIFGQTGDDLVLGGDGDDTIHGDEGNDTLYGDWGNDLVHGGQGNDVLFGGFGNDTLHGDDGNDVLKGQDGDDLLLGGTGRDQLWGGAGNDTLAGGGDRLQGGNMLDGGDDRDTFLAGNGDTVLGGDGGDDFDTLDLRGLGPFKIIDKVPDSDGNGIDGVVQLLDKDGKVIGTITFKNIEDIIPCFTPGTAIATPRGEKPVEELEVGDKVITRDNGIQEIRWIGARSFDWKALAASPHLQPVLIRAGSLGNGLPERDMLVSPNHRMLVANSRTALYFEEHEVLVAAKHLVDHRGVKRIDSIGTTYLHFMCDRHEVVLANGAWTESFQPGDLSLKGLDNAQRSELYEIFPDLRTPVGIEAYAAARKTLKAHEARLLF